MDLDLLDYANFHPGSTYQSATQQHSDLPSDEPFVASNPLDTNILHQWLCDHVVDGHLRAAQTVVVFTDTKNLHEYDFFAQCTGDLWWQRLHWTNGEKLHAVFVPICSDNGLISCHMTHAAVHVLRSLRSRFPGKHFISADADVGPTALSEVSQWISIAGHCERLRMPSSGCDKSTGRQTTPGLLVCTDKGARVNAGLVISPGLGPSDVDLAQTPEEWSRLLEARLETLMAKRSCSRDDFVNQRYSDHMAALARGTKLFGVLVEEPQDFLHIWAVICNVLTVAAWPNSASRFTRSRLDQFSESIRVAVPALDRWAGPFCEQPALSFLEAFQTAKLRICYMASEFGFMMQTAPIHMGTRHQVLESAVMPAVFLHGYGSHAKDKLTKYKMDFWVTMAQSLHGAMRWRPCFMDGPPGSVSRVDVAAGFQVEIQIFDCCRGMVHNDGWCRTTPSCNALFSNELSRRSTSASIWPLWSSIVHEQLGDLDEQSRSSDVLVCQNPVSSISIACPGLQNRLLEHGQSGCNLFDSTPHLVFTNAGSHKAYGPTRERADHQDLSRSDDWGLNALHFILVDKGCVNAWNIVLPQWEVDTVSYVAACCPSWIADPCSTSVFAVIASISQFMVFSDNYLRFFGLHTPNMPAIIVRAQPISIRGSLSLLFHTVVVC